MYSENSKTIVWSLIVLAMIISSSAQVLSDPVEFDDTDGTRTAQWDLMTPSDHDFYNTTMEPGYLNLSQYGSSWLQTSFEDFNTSKDFKIKNDIDIRADGSIALKQNQAQELLTNGNFTTDGDIEWDFQNLGDSATGQWANERWEILSVDPSPVASYSSSTWLNQSFNLPSVPSDMNISAFHNFTLGDETYEINNGSLARIMIKSPWDPPVILNYRDWANISDMAWVELWSDNRSMFNSSGLYTISLFTFTESNESNRQLGGVQPGVLNLWDDASIKFSSYESDGCFTSEVLDAGSLVLWNNISWTESLPSGTDISFQVRAGNSLDPEDSIWSNWSTPLTDPASSTIDLPVSQFIQYRANFTTSMTNITPILSDVNISYNRHYLNGVLETMDLIPGNVTNWGFFTHSEELRGQYVSYKYSTDSGVNWYPVPPDGDLRSITPLNMIRFRALLNTMDTSITPSVRSMQLDYVASDPAISLEGQWDMPEVEPGMVTRLHVFLNNTAQSTSSSTWLSIYLDPNMMFMSDNADALSIFYEKELDNSTGIYRYHFTDTPQGNYSFWLEARANTGIDNGTSTSTIMAIEYNDPLDNRVGSYLKEISNTLISPMISLEVLIDPHSADVGDVIHYWIMVNNTGGGSSPASWLNGTLDNRLDFLDSAGSSLNGSDISWELPSIASYSNLAISMNMTLKDNVLQGSAVPTSFSINYSDISGFMRSSVSNDEDLICELRSSVSLDMVSQIDHVRPGDAFIITVYYNNSEHGAAISVDIEIEIPDGLELDSSSVPWTSSGENHLWSFSNVMPGPHSYTATIKALDISDRIAHTNITARMTVMDPIDGLQEVIIPSPLPIMIESYISNIEMDVISPSPLLRPGDIIVFTVYYNNTGDGPASLVTFSLNMPYGLEFQSSSIPRETDVAYTWNFTEVSPGSHSFTISLRAADISEESVRASYRVIMVSSDPIDGERPAEFSDDITLDIERIITIWEKIYWPWSGILLFILLSIIIIILWNKYKPIPPSIDDAFLIYKDGRLISHQKSTHGLRAELDGDIVSAMLTAVQQFVNDSLDETGTDKIRKLEFGDRELFMERGENIYMAIMFTGTLTKKLDDQITELIGQIENEFPELAAWNGRMKGLENIDDKLKELINEWQQIDDEHSPDGDHPSDIDN